MQIHSILSSEVRYILNVLTKEQLEKKEVDIPRGNLVAYTDNSRSNGRSGAGVQIKELGVYQNNS